MPEFAYLLLAAVFNLSGMAWLALSMEVHWEQVMHSVSKRRSARPRWTRLAGATAHGGSLMACLAADRPSMAVLVWVMLLAASAFGVAMTLSYRPRWLTWWASLHFQASQGHSPQA
ncbi:DUF3325 domain-containing protein [Hydrogenophaga sp. 5NK40-0174]|uniref:DUF3325 domain-containing protein n=1 Tax=Hydrogenophaga sp. 5NK40-0174 TaxID=3127649 RepID=UPI00310A54AE